MFVDMKSKMKNTTDIALIGRVDLTNEMVDGQTVKSRTLYKALQKYTNYNVHLVETKDYKRRPGRVFFQLIRALRKSDAVILIVSKNGRHFFFPLMYIVAKVFKKRIYHDCIGGRLAREVKQYPNWRKYLNAFRANWMESEILVSNLQSEGIRNAVYLPNFKLFKNVDSRTMPITPPFRFCTFSRVMKQKGIDHAIQTIQSMNVREGTIKYQLDIYGPIEDDYRDEFFDLVSRAADCVRYQGVAKPDEGAKIVGNYYGLLFPTMFYSEGFPGTILDALAAGVPVIASRWAYYDQMLQDGVTGFSYPIEEPSCLKEAILELLALSPEEYSNMSKECKKSSEQYSADHVVPQIVAQLEMNSVQ